MSIIFFDPNIGFFMSRRHFSHSPTFVKLTCNRTVIGRLPDWCSKQEFSSPPAFTKLLSRPKSYVFSKFCSHRERFRSENSLLLPFDIKKNVEKMSHPEKNCFLISIFPYLNKIWRTNSYCQFDYRRWT